MIVLPGFATLVIVYFENCSSITETTELVNQLRAQNLILFSSVSHDALDESPMAYKDSVTILENIRPTAEMLGVIRPVYNFKAGRDIG